MLEGGRDVEPQRFKAQPAEMSTLSPLHPVVHGAAEQEVSSSDLSKWKEMVDCGIDQYMRDYRDRFCRRVRRGIPTEFRWLVWKAAMKLDEHKMEIDYPVLCEHVNEFTPAIEMDIGRTFTEVKTFDWAYQQSLRRLLNAYANYNFEVGYCQGMNFVAGLLLLVSAPHFASPADAEEESFRVLVCLMDHGGLSGFYRAKLPLLRRYLRACDKLVADTVPELREHFIKQNVQPAVYLHQWFLTLFINCFPLSMVLIIWDVIVVEGLPVILRIAVSILQVLKESLLSMEFEDIIKFFKMMKTYDATDSDLNAFRIGQLLMKHTEHILIPKSTLESLTRPLDDEGNLDSDESWEVELKGGSWLHSIVRMFAGSWSTKQRASETRRQSASAEPGPSGPGPPQLSPRPMGADAPGAGRASGSVGGHIGDAQRAGVGIIDGSEEALGSSLGGSISFVGRGLSGRAGGSVADAAASAEEETLTRGWEFL